MHSNDKLKWRNLKAVLPFHTPNRDKYPEKFVRHLLFIYYPFRCENELKSNNSGMYIDKLNEPGVLGIVNRKKEIFEPYGDLVDTALLNLRSNLSRCDANAQ